MWYPVLWGGTSLSLRDWTQGSTGKITYDLHKGFLKKNIDSIVIYGRGKKINDVNVFKISNEYYSKFNSKVSGCYC